MSKKTKLTLIGCIGAVEAMAYISGKSAQSSPGSWYQALAKSTLTPPPITFSIIWPLLYMLIGIALYKILQLSKKARTEILILFFSQLLLNYLWTPFFFGMQQVWTAFALLFLLVVVLSVLMIKLAKQRATITLLLTPYFIWSLFALYLNGYIAFHSST